MTYPSTAPKKQEIPPEILSLILNLNWSIQPTKKGNTQIRFWWPPKGEPGAIFRGISTGAKSDKIPKDRQTELVAHWFIKEGFSPAPKPKKGSLSLEEECEEYLKMEYEYKGHPSGTIKPIRQSLRRLREALAEGVPDRKVPRITTVPEITREAIHAIIPKLKAREKNLPGKPTYLKPKAWKNLFNNIRAFLRWEMQRTTAGVRHLKEDPTLGVETPTKAEIKRSRPVRTPWPEDEFKATLSKISVRVQKLKTNARETSADYLKDLRFTVSLLRYGGMDVNDCYRLLSHHIEEDGDGRLWIKKLRGKAKINSGAEMIKLPVSTKIETELRNYWMDALVIGPEAHVLPWHKRFSNHASFSSWIWKNIQSARSRAGLPPRDIKSFRHTFVTSHLKRGKVKLRQLREWLGHAPDSKMIEDTYDLSEYGAEAMD
jgi:integrase